MDSDVNKYLKETQSESSDINILLLGETGVGKSTFINSFANYLSYESLAKVRKTDLLSLIPTRFAMVDVDFNTKIVEFGEDKNEDTELGNSSTQGARAYIFNHKDGFKIRLIDTPGIGDSRGIEQDQKNFENVLSYIGQFESLHAICFLLKPNESVLNAYFRFCLMHLFSRLEKSASENICFIFTNARSTFYKPGETLPILKRVLNEIETNKPFVKIPCSKDNMFCVDNEGFKYLVSSKQNIKFGEREEEIYSTSFNVSVDACQRLLNYIRGDPQRQGIRPHVIQKTLSVNEARRVIIDLSRPLADIADLIDDNLVVLERHQKSILSENITITELQKRLFVPAVNIRQTTLSQPVTICTASKCSETYTIEGMSKYHYKQRCHNPCYLTNVPTEIVGSPELRSCAAMAGTQNCKQCSCHFTSHMHILYETDLVQAKLEDESVKVVIRSKEDMIKQQFRMIQKLQVHCKAYEDEKKTISKTMAKFAHFLEKSSIVLYNDSYTEYINYLIDRENSLGSRRDKDMILRYQELKKLYEQEKNLLDMALDKSKRSDVNAVLLQPSDIFTSVRSLYSLKYTGKKIKELHQQQERLRKVEHGHFMEYHCPSLQTTDTEDDEELDFSGSQVTSIMRKLIKENSLEDARKMIRDLDLTSQFSDEKKIDDFKQELFDLASSMFDKNKNQSDGNKGAMPKSSNRRNTNFKQKKKVNNTNPRQSRANYQNNSNNYPPTGQQFKFNNYPPPLMQQQFNMTNPRPNHPPYRPMFQQSFSNYPPQFNQSRQDYPRPPYNSRNYDTQYPPNRNNFPQQPYNNYNGPNRPWPENSNSNLGKKMNNLSLNNDQKSQDKFQNKEKNPNRNRQVRRNDSTSESDGEEKISEEMELVRQFLSAKKKDNEKFIFMYKKK